MRSWGGRRRSRSSATCGPSTYDIPRAREGDFATAPGAIEAFDAAGAKLGERPLASVAYWHRRNGG